MNNQTSLGSSEFGLQELRFGQKPFRSDSKPKRHGGLPCNKSDTHLPSRLHGFPFDKEDKHMFYGGDSNDKMGSYSKGYSKAKQRSCSEDLQYKGLPKTREIKKSNSLSTYRTFRIDSLDESSSPVHAQQKQRRKSKSIQIFKKQCSVPETAIEQHVASLRLWNNTVKRNSQPDNRLEDTRLVVLGSGNVGKSSLVQQFVHDSFPTCYKPTLQDTHRHLLQLPGGVLRAIEIVDTAGIHQFPAMRMLSIQSADAFVVVYAVDDRESFHEAMDLVQLIKDAKSKQTPSATGPYVSTGGDRGQMWPIMVVGNKSDLASSRSITRSHAEQKSRDESCFFVETSAKDNDNVTKLFTDLLVSVYGGEYMLKHHFGGGGGKLSVSEKGSADKRSRHKCAIL